MLSYEHCVCILELMRKVTGKKNPMCISRSIPIDCEPLPSVVPLSYAPGTSHSTCKCYQKCFVAILDARLATLVASRTVVCSAVLRIMKLEVGTAKRSVCSLKVTD